MFRGFYDRNPVALKQLFCADDREMQFQLGQEVGSTAQRRAIAQSWVVHHDPVYCGCVVIVRGCYLG